MIRAFQQILLIALVANVVSAADWDSKPFPDWPEKTVLRLVTDSPWAKQIDVPLEWKKREERPLTPQDVPGATPQGAAKAGSPVGGIGAGKPKMPLGADLIVRWASALPVRQAKALYKQRNERTEVRNPSDLIEARSSDYVLEIYGIPAEVAHLGTESVEAVAMSSAWLRTKSGRLLKPNRVEAKVHALTLTLLIHFSRDAAITLKDQEVECFVDMQIFQAKAKFKLDSMKYLGALEM